MFPVLNVWCFLYKYDDKGRNILKKAPGVKELRMFYDQRDSVVFICTAGVSFPSHVRQPREPRYGPRYHTLLFLLYLKRHQHNIRTWTLKPDDEFSIINFNQFTQTIDNPTVKHTGKTNCRREV